MKKYLKMTIILLMIMVSLFFPMRFFYVQGSSIDDTQEESIIEEEKTANSFITLLNDGVLYAGQLLEEVLLEVVSSGAGKVTPSIDSIIFNEYPITRIDYFRKNVKINEEYNNLGMQLKEAVSFMYSLEVATVMSIFIFFLIYIGIKIITESIADKKAKYKENLIAWVIGLLMLLFFHFVMYFVVETNDLMVDFARNIIEKSTNSGTMTLQNLVNKFKIQAFTEQNIVKAIIWLVLLLKTLIIFFKYLKRLITVTILILLFPFVSLGYVFDKLKGGRTKIFDIWLTAFLQNIFINFIDAVVYLIAVQIFIDNQISLLIPMIAVMIFDNISDEITKIIGIDKNTYLSPINATSIISQNNKDVIKNLKENIKNINKKEEEKKNYFEINAINSLGKYDSKKNKLIITSETENKSVGKFASSKKINKSSKIELNNNGDLKSSKVNIGVEEVINKNDIIKESETINYNINKVNDRKIINENKIINQNENNSFKNNTVKTKENSNSANITPKIEVSDILPKINLVTNTSIKIEAKDLELLNALNNSSDNLSSIEKERKIEEKEMTYEKDKNEKYSIDNVLKKAGINPEELTQEEKIEIYKEQLASIIDIKKDAKIEMKKKQKFNKKL